MYQIRTCNIFKPIKPCWDGTSMDAPGYRIRDRRCFTPEGVLIENENDQEMCLEELFEREECNTYETDYNYCNAR